MDARAESPDLGKPQFESHSWLEPIVCHVESNREY
jgi:hypothetical protein